MVEKCEAGKFEPGSWVLLTGNYAGQHMNGGYAEKIQLPSDWLIQKPPSLTPEQTMIIGTAGFTAMQSLMYLEKFGKINKESSILVSGASGGVGSTFVAIAKHLGYSNITASTGRAENKDWLQQLGAKEVVSRLENSKPLDIELYDAAVDTVGGDTLAAILARLKYNGAVACSGVAGGAKVATTVFPFILRGVSVLGVDSVQLDMDNRRKVERCPTSCYCRCTAPCVPDVSSSTVCIPHLTNN